MVSKKLDYMLMNSPFLSFIFCISIVSALKFLLEIKLAMGIFPKVKGGSHRTSFFQTIALINGIRNFCNFRFIKCNLKAFNQIKFNTIYG